MNDKQTVATQPTPAPVTVHIVMLREYHGDDWVAETVLHVYDTPEKAEAKRDELHMRGRSLFQNEDDHERHYYLLRRRVE